MTNKAQEQRRQRRRQLQHKKELASSSSSSRTYEPTTQQVNVTSSNANNDMRPSAGSSQRKPVTSPSRRALARRNLNNNDEDSYDAISEPDVDFDPNDISNDRVERRRALHRIRKNVETRKQVSQSQNSNNYQQNSRGMDAVEENRSINTPTRDKLKSNTIRTTTSSINLHKNSSIPTQQYSKPTQRYIESYHEDHDNPPPILSKATSETSHTSTHLSNNFSHDSHTRSQTHSVRYSESAESRDTLRVQHITQNNSYRNQNAFVPPTHQNYTYHLQQQQYQPPSHNFPRDDSTADHTTVTEDSGGARLQHYHQTPLDQNHETFRSKIAPEFADFDDETTVFDTGTVNTLDDDSQVPHSFHQQQQRRQDSYLSNGYSSLGRGTVTGTGTDNTMPNSVSSSTSGIKHSRSKDEGKAVHGNSSIPTNQHLRNSFSIPKQDTTLTSAKPAKSNTSIASDHGTQLTYDDNIETRKRNNWNSTQHLSYHEQNENLVQESFSKTFKEIGTDEEKMKVAVGCSAAAAIGALVIGPVGLLVGASVGLMGGFYQIPHEKRSKVTEAAKTSFSKATDKALHASENISNSCVTAFERNGFEVPDNCLPKRGEQEDGSDTMGAGGYHNPSWLSNHFDVKDDGSDVERFRKDHKDDDGTIESANDGLLGNFGGVIANVGGDGGDGGDKGRRRTVACLRKTRITPVGQIHAMKPSSQPRAWLEIMASALTTDDEKNEAMEEILILVKDKEHTRIFLEEGILDSLMYILSTSFQKLPPPAPEISETDGSPIFHDKSRIPHNNETFIHAKLAANCCVAFGKAHCAVVHTEGDLLLMSAYNRGSVPVERQLAQLLFEVPHHSRMMGTNMGEILEDGTQEEFMLTEMSMQQAEEMAKNIKALVEGRLEWN